MYPRDECTALWCRWGSDGNHAASQVTYHLSLGASDAGGGGLSGIGDYHGEPCLSQK